MKLNILTSKLLSAKEVATFTKIHYNAPVRTESFPNGKGSYGSLSKVSDEFFEATDVKGDGYCGSYAVSDQLKEIYYDMDWVDIENLTSGVLIRTKAKAVVCYDKATNQMHMYKNPNQESNKIVRIVRKNNHYMSVNKFKNTIINATLLVNWPVLAWEIDTYIGFETTLSKLALYTLNPSSLPSIQAGMVELAIYSPMHHFDEDDLLELKKHISPEQLKMCVRTSISPELMQENISSFCCGANPCDLTGYMFDMLDKSPYIRFMETDTIKTYTSGNQIRYFGKRYNVNEYQLQNIEVPQSYKDYEKIRYRQVVPLDEETGKGDVWEVFCSSDEEGKEKVLKKNWSNQSSLDSSSDSGLDYSTIMPNRKKLSPSKAKKTHFKGEKKQNRKKEKEEALKNAVVKAAQEELSFLTSSWPEPESVSTSRVEQSNIRNLILKQLKKTEDIDNGICNVINDLILTIPEDVLSQLITGSSWELIKFEEIVSKNIPKQLINSELLLWVRGLIFENLVRHYKQSYREESTMSEFIINMNKSNPNLSKKLWAGNLCKCNNKVEISAELNNLFRGSMIKKMDKLVNEKTPDIISVSTAGDWVTLIVCDPSSAKTPIYREKEKLSKYQDYRLLKKAGQSVDFRVETPVIRSTGTNVNEVIFNITKSIPIDSALNHQAASLVGIFSAAFEAMRSNSPMVEQEYQSSCYPIDLGVVEPLVEDIHDYLTDRDLELLGLDRDETKAIFDLDTNLTFEKQECVDELKQQLIAFLKGTIDHPTDNGSCSDRRDDIHFDPEKKLATVKSCLAELSEEPKDCRKTYSPDAMGHIPAPNCYKPTKSSGASYVVDLLEQDYLFKDETMTILMRVLNDMRPHMSGDVGKAIKGLANASGLIRKKNQTYIKKSYSEANSHLTESRIVQKNTVRLLGRNREEWVKICQETKTRKSGVDLLLGMNENSVKRIEKLQTEMEKPSSGNPVNCLIDLMGEQGYLSMGNLERGRMRNYFQSKGSQFMASLHKMCYELNILINNDMSENEMSFSNLGLENVVAIAMPGCRLSDSSLVRHVKICIKEGDVLVNQGFRGIVENGWFVQDGFCKISHKTLVHFINMFMCLSPLYNELSSITDDKDDKMFKRTIHQVYWLAADSCTNKMLGVVRYLALLVFATVCNPKALILDELKCEELKWRKDIHVHTINEIQKNLPIMIRELSNDHTMEQQFADGEMITNVHKPIKRLLGPGYHNTFKDMLNEFYMYYTWNKSSVGMFEGCKRITNKLLKSRHECLTGVKGAMDHLKKDRSIFDNTEFHLNTGIRLGFMDKNDYIKQIPANLDYLLRDVPEKRQGVGSAAYLSAATSEWLKEHSPESMLVGTYFQPLMSGLEELSNTRGSLVRNDMLDNNKPILSNKFMAAMKNCNLSDEAKRNYQSLRDKGEIDNNEFEERMKELDEDKTVEDDLGEVKDMPDNPYEKSRVFIGELNGRRSITRRKISKYLKKMGYDIRSKCILNVLDYLLKYGEEMKNVGESLPKLKLDYCIADFIKRRLDMLHGLSPKTQHLSDRELRIMDIFSKAGMKVVEDVARLMNSLDKRETSTTDKSKMKTQELSSRTVDNIQRTGKAIGIKLSADKSKWGPSVLPSECIPMLRQIGKRVPSLKGIVKICIFMVIKLQSKRVLVPTELLTNWWSKDMDIKKMELDLPHVAEFMQSFDPTKNCSFDNVNDMGQGIMNAFTSFKHLCTTTYSNKLYYSIVPKNSFTVDFCQLSSDDSLEMQTFIKDRKLKSAVNMWLTTKTFCWRLSNMISNKKKTAGCLKLSEYNSNFCLPPYSTPPNIKQIVACGMVNFHYSWSETVKTKLSELKSAAENGVTNSTCLFINHINKTFFERVFGIDKIKSVIKEVSQNYVEIIDRMDSGNIEFGRFPIVDPVKLNLIGSSEIVKEGLQSKRQLDILVNLVDNPFFETQTPEIEESDIKLNTLNIRSMRFKLYKIEMLEKSRTKFKEGAESIGLTEAVSKRLKEENPFYLLKKPTYFYEQYNQLLTTLGSSSMQSAFSNFDGLRGIMRVFGLRYNANYGIKGSKTENSSFTMLMVLMNLATSHKFPEDTNYLELTTLDPDNPADHIANLKQLVRNSSGYEKKLSFPSQFEVLNNISEEMNSLVGQTKPKEEPTMGNLAEPTLMRRPAWNTEFMLRNNPLDALSCHWEDVPGRSFIKPNTEYDTHVLGDKFLIKESYRETLKEWGLPETPESVQQVGSWLVRLSNNSYKPSKLIYGRGTTYMGVRRLASDLYCFNQDTDYTYEPTYLTSNTPLQWNYSADLYDFLMSCALLLPLSKTYMNYRNICLASLNKMNEARVEEGLDELRIDPSVVTDSRVHADMRLTACYLLNKQPNGKTVDYSTGELLKDCVSTRSYRYIRKQDVNTTLDRYIVDSSCSVEYYSTEGVYRITTNQNSKPIVQFHNNSGSIDEYVLAKHVKDYLNNRSDFSFYSDDKLDVKKFKTLNNPKYSKGTIVGHFNLKINKFSTIYVPNSIPVTLFNRGTSIGIPRNPRDQEFKVDWDDKSIRIIDSKDKPKQVNYYNRVLRYTGRLHCRSINHRMAQNMINYMQHYMGDEEGQNLLAAIKVYDDLTPLNMTTTQFSGGAISACFILNNNREIPQIDTDEVTSILLESSYIEKGLDHGKYKGIDMTPYQSPTDEEWIPYFTKTDPIEKEKPWHESDWAKDMSQFADTLTFTVTGVDPSLNLEAFDTEDYDKDFMDLGIEVNYTSSSTPITVGEKLDSVVRRYVSKWKTTNLVFKPTSNMTSTELLVCQLVAYETVKHMTPIFQDKVSELNKSDSETIEELDKIGAIISESYSILSLPIGNRKHTSLLELASLAIESKKKIQSITGITIDFKVINFRRSLNEPKSMDEVLYEHFPDYDEEDESDYDSDF